MRKYILFGAGTEGERILSILGKERVAYICDNEMRNICDMETIPFSQLQKIHMDYTVLVAVSRKRYLAEIVGQLGQAGIPFTFLEDIAESELQPEIEKYSAMNQRKSFSYDKTLFCPILDDKQGQAGSVKGNSYFWQDLWAAQRIFKCSPHVHMDIGSRVDGFIAHLLSFGQKVCLLDIRPMECVIPGVDFMQCDATSLVDIPDGSVESLSALCSLEHFGLGRYGDPIDPEACFRCFEAIQQKAAFGGYVYVSVPVGQEHVEFNAHRIFYASTVRDAFSDMDLLEYSVVHPDGIEFDVDLHKHDRDMNIGADRFGLFMFRKRCGKP